MVGTRSAVGRRWILGLLFIIAFAVFAALAVRSRLRSAADSAPHEPARLADSPAPAQRFTGYVGDAACVECHAEIVDSYRRTGMARSWSPAVDVPPAEDAVVRDPQSGFEYRVVSEDGRCIQEESLIEPLDDHSHLLRRTASYAVGSGDHARTLLWDDHGYLYQLPLAWYATRGVWGLNPGYELHNHRFDRVIPPGCIACHGTHAVHREPTRNRYELPIIDGIGCERCHGPGRAHVAFRKQPANADGPRGETRSATDPIVNPARLAPATENDICLQCHLQGDVTVYPPGRDEFSFRPGERLRDHRLDFLIKTDQPESFGVASHGARMMRSACRTETGDSLGCVSCHDPHVPIGDAPPATYDARCVECHAPRDCSRDGTDAEKAMAAGCVGCHMPQRTTREGQHLVFTDHWIRRFSGHEPQPELLPPNAAVELVACWPEADPDGYRLASALILLHETMGPQEPSLARGVELLRTQRARGPLDSGALYALGSGLVSQHRSREAIEVFRALLTARPDDLTARFRLAIAHDQLGDYNAAVAEYQQVIDAAPDWLEPYPLLSRLLLQRGESARARLLLQQSLARRRDVDGLTALAAVEIVARSAPEKSVPILDQVLELDPKNVPVRLQRAFVLQQSGDVPSALAAFRVVLKIDPDNALAVDALRALEQLPGTGQRSVSP